MLVCTSANTTAHVLITLESLERSPNCLHRAPQLTAKFKSKLWWELARQQRRLPARQACAANTVLAVGDKEARSAANRKLNPKQSFSNLYLAESQARC